VSVTAADVAAAAARLAGQIVVTPCLPSRTLTDITGAELWLKFENLQYTASFKERGALNCLMQLSAGQAAAGVVAMSAGNHAQGVAYHARRLGIPATIVMPRHTPFVKVENTRRFGARVALEGEGVEEAARHAWALAKPMGYASFILSTIRP
jgi:threonine dehydratase